ATYPILRGRWLILEFSIILKNFYEDQTRGLFGFNPNKIYGYIEFKEKQVLPLVNASYSILNLTTAKPLFRYDKENFQRTYKLNFF
ncbi:28350_t:CDS:1, partial [Racocetra persica]